ncbi:MAG: hypothetical protein KC613_18335, partial [Myxococcales bacterium]|nr:hypothetical protein [Myxococcales bacterium]
MFERRWITWGLAGAMALGGCDDGKKTPPTDGPGDNPATAGLRLDEAQIAATPRSGGLDVRVLLQRTGAADAAGTVTVSLHRLGEEAALAIGSADFLANQDTAAVDVGLTLAEDLGLADPSSLAGFVLRYRVSWDGAPLWGRRSLFAAAKLAEAQLLSSDTFQVDVPAFVRLMTRDPNSGEALTDLPVTVGIERGEGDEVEFTALFQGRTDALGQLAAQLQPGEDLVGAGNLVVRVETPTGPQEMRAQVAVERATKILVTTDKPLYQPGQTMHLRALALRRPNLGPDADTKVIWEIFDGKDNKVERVETRTDDFGVTSFQFKLAREVNMGRYRIVATVGDTVTEKTVTVDRYVLPKFDLDLDLDRAVYFAGDRIVGTVRARYFFGEAVAGGQVSLSASTVDAGETVFANLQGATNAEGLYQFEIQVPDYIVGQPLEQGGGLINLALEVTDTAGQARTVSQLVRIARGPLELAVVPESGSYVPGVAQKLLLRTTDAAGAPTSATVRLTVNGNALEPVDTNANGLGFVRVVAFEPQLDIQAVAVKGDDEITESFQFAAGDPAPEGSLLVRTDRALYRVGDTLRFEAHVAGAQDRLYLDVIRGGQTVLTDTLTLDDQGTGTYELTLTPDHAGPLKLSAYYLAQGSSLRRDSATVYVDLANDLRLSFETDRDTYAPGEEATLNVRVTDADGNPQVAAVGLQGVDEAVYSLMEFRPGLENTYFRIEGELGEPRYQIGVPGLATLVSGGGAVDDER